MYSCAEYSELISAYADSELSPQDMQRMDDHLSICADCASIFETYRAISSCVEESLVDAPEALRNGVMNKLINRAPTEAADADKIIIQDPTDAANKFISQDPTDAADKIKKFKRVNVILTRYIPLAACLAFLLLTIPILIRNGGFNRYRDGASSPSAVSKQSNIMDEYEQGSMSGGGSPDYMNRDAEDNAGYDTGGYDQDASFAAPAGSPAAPEAAPMPSSAATQEISGAPAPAPMPAADVAGGERDDVWNTEAPEESIGSNRDGEIYDSVTDEMLMPEEPGLSTGGGNSSSEPEYMEEDIPHITNGLGSDTYPDRGVEGAYAVITIHGDKPALLDRYAPESIDDAGTALYILPSAVADALLREVAGRQDVFTQAGVPDSEYIWVYYIQ